MADPHEPSGCEPPPRPKRRVADIDVSAVAEALGDNDGMTVWWYDPATGEVETRLAEGFGDDDEEDDDPLDRGMVFIDREGSHDAYQDMVELAEAVADPRPADLLIRALEGRGAFRRFRDTLDEFPLLREHWSVYSRACAEIRAIGWLQAFELVEDVDAEEEVATRSAAADAVLAAVGRRSGLQVESSAVPRQWADIVAAIDAGQTVTLLRSGEVWALVEPGR